MARYIDPNRPYTDEDKKYLLTRAGGKAAIAINDRRFGTLSETKKKALRKDAEVSDKMDEEAEARRKQAEEEEFHPDDVAIVQPLKAAECKTRLKKLGIAPEGETLEDLQLQLLEYYDDVRKGNAK